MTERLLIALTVVVGVLVALALARAWLRLRNRRVLARVRASVTAERDAARDALAGAPRLLYFTTASCVVCRVQQEPAIDRLLEHVPDLRVDRHDAVTDRELAARYGVLSVPTIAIFNRAGELVTINRGFVPAAVLFAQLEGREPDLDGGLPALSEPVVR